MSDPKRDEALKKIDREDQQPTNWIDADLARQTAKEQEIQARLETGRITDHDAYYERQKHGIDPAAVAAAREEGRGPQPDTAETAHDPHAAARQDLNQHIEKTQDPSTGREEAQKALDQHMDRTGNSPAERGVGHEDFRADTQDRGDIASAGASGGPPERGDIRTEFRATAQEVTGSGPGGGPPGGRDGPAPQPDGPDTSTDARAAARADLDKHLEAAERGQTPEQPQDISRTPAIDIDV